MTTHVSSILLLAFCGCSGAPSVVGPSEERREGSAKGPATVRKGAVAYKVSERAGVEELVGYALRHSPRITAAEMKVRRLSARIDQEGALPDPMFGISMGSMAETAAGRMETMAGVEQKLPFPGKLRAKAAAAGREAEAAVAELELTRQGVAEEVRAAYWDLYLAGEMRAITLESGVALGLVRDSVDAQVAVNKASQDDQLRLATESGKVEQALVEAGRMEGGAKAQLNALLNRPRGSPLPGARAEGVGSRGALSSLLAKAEREHPAVRVAESEMAAFEERLKLADLGGFPDFSLGIQHGSVADYGLSPMANGRDQVFATLGVSLPIWRAPRRAMVEEARAGIGESEAKVDAVRSRLRFQVEDAWLRAKSAEQLIRLFDKQILPEAKQAFDVVLTGYTAGTQSFVDLLDAWRNHLGFRLQQAGNRAAYGKAIAALRSAVGEEP